MEGESEMSIVLTLKDAILCEMKLLHYRRGISKSTVKMLKDPAQCSFPSWRDVPIYAVVVKALNRMRVPITYPISTNPKSHTMKLHCAMHA